MPDFTPEAATLPLAGLQAAVVSPSSRRCHGFLHIPFVLLPQVCCALQVAYGESHKIVGGHPSLGSWDVGSAPTMKWSDGDVWTLVVDYPAGQKLEFKAWPKAVACKPALSSIRKRQKQASPCSLRQLSACYGSRSTETLSACAILSAACSAVAQPVWIAEHI